MKISVDLIAGEVVFVVIILRRSELKFIRSTREFILKADFHCKTANFIYVIICIGYKEEYIDE